MSSLAVAVAAAVVLAVLGVGPGLVADGASGQENAAAVAGPTTSPTTPSAPPETTIAEIFDVVPIGEVATVTLIEPRTTGAGPLPTFRWEPVAGATEYMLAVLTHAGEPVWAWQGAETSVMLGGWEVAPADVNVPGPLIAGASVWFVAAFDATGAPIAVSEMRPVAQ